MEVFVAFESNSDRLQASLDVIKYCREKGFHQFGWEFVTIAQYYFQSRKNLTITNKKIIQLALDWEKSILAFYVNRPLVGHEACENIMHLPDAPSWMKEQNLSNLAHYISCITHYCDVEISEIMHATENENKDVSFFINPSVTIRKNEMIYNLRGINYQYDIATNQYHYQGNIVTNNFITTLERNDWMQYKIDHIDPSRVPPKFPSLIQGYEDVRLFAVGDKLYGIATCREHSEENINQMCLIDIDKQHVVLLHGYGDKRTCEKNWAPLVTDRTVYLVYSYSPLIVLKCDTISGLVSEYQTSSTISDFSSYRGGSQFIPLTIQNQDGFIGVIHQVAKRNLPGGRVGRYYYHRFVFMTLNEGVFDITKISHPFYFMEKTIEFASGLCHDVRSNILVLTFGFEDKQAYQMKMNSNQVEKIMKSVDYMYSR